jgi:hypothetical protein
MFRLAPLLFVVTACASAREQPQVADAANDKSRSDAAQHADAAVQPADAKADAPPSGSCASPFTGVLATYSFTGATGNQASTAASATATGMTAGPISRSAGLTAVSGATSINSSNWPLSATLDPTKYYALSVTPPAGCTLSLTSAAIDAKSSSTGPATASVATSADNFAAAVTISTSAPSTPTLAVTNATGAIEIRVYGYSASATAGTLRLQNTLTVSGSLN